MISYQPVTLRGYICVCLDMSWFDKTTFWSDYGAMSTNNLKKSLSKQRPTLMKYLSRNDFKYLLKEMKEYKQYLSGNREVMFVFIDGICSAIYNESLLARTKVKHRNKNSVKSEFLFEAQGLLNIGDVTIHHKIAGWDSFIELVKESLPSEKRVRFDKLCLNLIACVVSSNKESFTLAVSNIILEFVDIADVASAIIGKINFGCLYELFLRVYKYFNEPQQFEAQGLDYAASIDEDTFHSIFRFAATFYAFVFDEHLCNEKFLSSKWQNKLFTIYKNTSSIPEFVQFVTVFFKTVYEWFQVNVLGEEPDYDRMLCSVDEIYETWASDLYVIESMYLDKDRGVSRNPALRTKIALHYEKAQKLSKIIESLKTVTRGSYQHFLSQFSRCAKIAEITRKYNQCDRFRIPPYMFQFYGTSGVGKSTCLNRVSLMLNKLFDFGYEEGNLMFSRNQSSPYWEGYANQMMTIYDDMFQSKEPQQRSMTAEEIIHVRNSVPMALNMASVESKGNILFSSKFVAATTNILTERNLNIACPDAFWRRFNSRWTLRYPAKYSHPKGPLWDDMLRDNPDLAKEELMYKFLICELHCRDNSVRSFTFDGMINYIYADAKRYFESEEIVLESNRRVVSAEFESQGLIEIDDSHYPVGAEVEHNGRKRKIKLSLPKNFSYEAQGQTIDNNPQRLSRNILQKYFPDYRVGDFITVSDVEYAESKCDEILDRFLSYVNVRSDRQQSGGIERILNAWFDRFRPPPKRVNLSFLKRGVFKAGNISLLPGKKFLLAAGALMVSYFSIKYGIKIASHIKNMFIYDDIFVAHSNEFKDKKRRTPRKIKAVKSTEEKPKYVVVNGSGKYEARGNVISNDYMRKIKSNMINIKLKGSVDDAIICDAQQAIIITGNVILCTKHFIMRMLTCDREFGVLIISGPVIDKKIPISDVITVTPPDCVGGDYGLIKLGDRSIQRASIIERFLTQDDLNRCRIRDSQMIKLDKSSSPPSFDVQNIYDNVFSSNSPPYAAEDDSFELEDSMYFSLATQKGDCGSIIVTKDTSCDGVILGIHVAGKVGCDIGLGQVISREVLKEMLDAIGETTIRIRFPSVNAEDEKLYEKFEAYGNIDICGSLAKSESIILPTVSKIIPSKVHGVFQIPIKAPAMLTASGGVSPVLNSMEKANLIEGFYNRNLLEECRNYMEQKICILDTVGYARTLTNFECINGIRGSDHLKALSIDTSPGYPFVLNRKRSGKLDWFVRSSSKNNDIILMSKDFAAQMRNEEDLLFEGKIPFFPFTSCMKDETRPVEKVVQGKTRMFSVGNVMHLVLCRKYYGGFVAFLTAQSPAISSKVGLNMNGPQFHDFYNFMVKGRSVTESRSNFNDGDFGSFDDSIMSSLIRDFFVTAMNWYELNRDDDPNFERSHIIRKHLIETFMGPPHILGNVVYSLTRANCSGNFATVHINGFVNELTHRYIFCLLGRDYGKYNTDFDKDVNFATYGDDSLMCLSDSVKNWYNGITLGPIFKDHFGMKYTAANKSDIPVAVRDRSEVDFCKRKFVWSDDLGRVVGQLPMAGILETTNWIKKSVDDVESTVMNIQSAHREIFFYGQNEYDKWGKNFTTHCVRLGLPFVKIPYRQMVNEFWNGK